MNVNTNFYYADGLTNLKNAASYCSRNTNNPLDIRQCLVNIINRPVKTPTHQQIVSQIDNAFNRCKGNQQCFINAMNSMHR